VGPTRRCTSAKNFLSTSVAAPPIKIKIKVWNIANSATNTVCKAQNKKSAIQHIYFFQNKEKNNIQNILIIIQGIYTTLNLNP
jgi:hypothetical protein